ncbi:MAG: 2-amino-4-hydroxy-6-hydroxymethyldihydropteridine diphosphokinase [Treponema sp.]|nr:2-amino-4-hydroxy-6-hydroxymethyldihydropteridine diphosphokinase [Treponema sp.]
MTVVLGLGSNKPWQQYSSIELLVKAVRALKAFLHDIRFSSVYESAPMYVTDQAAFCNMVVAGRAEDSLSPHDLLDQIHKIEASLGRDRSREIRNGPRSIDIDIEFFGNKKIRFSDSQNPLKALEIPHPRINERPFVLIPLLEILNKSADNVDSTLYAHKEEFMQMLKVTGSDGVVKILDAEAFEKSV